MFSPNTPKDGVDLVAKMLQYAPVERVTALQACAHPFFDELREEGCSLPSGEAPPPLFNFTAVELSSEPDLAEKLIPEWARTEGVWPPPKLDPRVASRLIGAAKDGPRKPKEGGGGGTEPVSMVGSGSISGEVASSTATSTVGGGGGGAGGGGGDRK